MCIRRKVVLWCFLWVKWVKKIHKFKFSCQNLKLECNFFIWDEKVTTIWYFSIQFGKKLFFRGLLWVWYHDDFLIGGNLERIYADKYLNKVSDLSFDTRAESWPITSRMKLPSKQFVNAEPEPKANFWEFLFWLNLKKEKKYVPFREEERMRESVENELWKSKIEADSLAGDVILD